MTYYSDDRIRLHHVDVLKGIPLSDGSVDCIVTSPPYFGLRDYGVVGQIGTESSPAEYVEHLRQVFADARRVLTDDGTLWLNLGDSYYSGKGAPTQPDLKNSARRGSFVRPLDKPGAPWAKPKNLLGMPWRVALALQDDGWTLRCDIVWAKRNFLPDGATDRPTRSHEYVFMFSKKRRYWYDADAIREESAPEQRAHNMRYAKEYEVHTARVASTGQPGNVNNAGIHSRPGRDGRNARSVWSISSNPFPGAHFAVMPRELAEKCILAGCKPGGTVLDPFNGSGTTGMMALTNGRRYVGIDLNSDYLDLSLSTRLAAFVDQSTEGTA